MNRSLLILIVSLCLGSLPVLAGSPEPDLERMTLEVSGMQSDACESLIKEVLVSVSEHVREVEADHETGRVVVHAVRGKVEVGQLIKATESECSFRVLSSDPEPRRTGLEPA